MADFGVGEIASLAGVISSLAGTGLGIAGAETASHNMNQAVANEIAQQQAFTNQAKPIYQQNAIKATEPSAASTIAGAVQNTLGQYQQAQQAPTSTQPLSTSAPSKQVSAATQADVARSNAASAALQGYPALQTQWNVGNTNTNAQLGNIGSIAQTIAQAFPANMSAAQTSGNTLGGIGSLISSAGGLAGAFGSQYNNGQTYQQILDMLAASNPNLAYNPNQSTVQVGPQFGRQNVDTTAPIYTGGYS